jgi:peptide/nickel transport system substrate-binding protein
MYKRLSVCSIIVLAASLVLSGCGPKTAQTGQATAASSKYGGTLVEAYTAPTNMDPAFYSTVSDDQIGKQIYDFLVFIGEDLQPDVNRSLAEKWTVDQTGKIWTFNLRQGVLFQNGKNFTSRDVKFTFDRLRDPKVGAATVKMYSNIADISTPDDYTVVFTLNDPNPDFLKDLGDYHAGIEDADNATPGKVFNGTGPFMVKSYSPEDRITFARNPHYWMKDADGNQLPYLDGMTFLFLSDPSAQVEALQSGQVNYLQYLPVEAVPTLAKDPNVVVYQCPSNLSYAIHMRCDQKPASDPRVREALKLGTDNNAILQGAIGGLGVVGSDTPIGPSYKDFYLNVPAPQQDVAKAKQLLAEAGYPNGFTLTLVTQNSSPVPAIATIWKEQMADIGVTVNIQLVEPEVYYGSNNLWLTCAFGITDWGSRAYPQPYLDLSYVTNAQWNESHWSDPQLDSLAASAGKEMDPAKRADDYRQIQQIFIDRGPVIIPFFKNNMWAASSKLKGLKPTSYEGTAMDLRTVYFQN